MRYLIALLFTLGPAWADVVVATRTIRPHTILVGADVALANGSRAQSFDRVEDVIGQETRVALYAGRPILIDSIGPPALVDRNQIVSIWFKKNGLVISTDGRALERGGIGDRVRIMNLSSRTTLFGFVQADGSVIVKN